MGNCPCSASASFGMTFFQKMRQAVMLSIMHNIEMTVEIIRLDDLADEIEEMLVGYAENITQGINHSSWIP